MSIDLVRIAELLDKAANQYKGLVEASDAFRELGSLEAARIEKERLLAVATKELAEANEGLALVRQKMQELESAAVAELAQAKEAAQLISNDAQNRSSGMLLKAQGEAEKRIADAKEEAHWIVEKARRDLSDMLAETAQLQEAKKAALAELADAKERTTAEKDKLAEARATLRELLGGGPSPA